MGHPLAGRENMSLLFAKASLGALPLQNHLVMSPMTRNRALGNIPNELMAQYYAQRASAGLILTEGTSPSANGLGYARIPGMFSAPQVAGWKPVVAGVHARGAKMFVQLMHCGRIAHPLNLPPGARIVAPSAIAAAGQMYTDAEGLQLNAMPQAMTGADINAAIGEYAHAASSAMQAGFDGVELHGANGYLLDQFLRDGSNRRTDAYGGSTQKRARFPLEVVEAVVGVWGSQSVGYKLSPHFAGYSMSDSNPIETFSYLAEQLSGLRVGYLHVGEAIAGPMAAPAGTIRVTPMLRDKFSGTVIVNGGYDAHSGHAAIARGEADLVAFGVPFLANPDLPARYRKKASLNPPDQTTFYAGEEKGYIDYPALA
jgi:N-ethylmaleimide reductase